jgi:hypothetical protein
MLNSLNTGPSAPPTSGGPDVTTPGTSCTML